MKLSDKFKKPYVEHQNVDMQLKDKEEMLTIKNDFIKIVPKSLLKEIAI